MHPFELVLTLALVGKTQGLLHIMARYLFFVGAAVVENVFKNRIKLSIVSGEFLGFLLFYKKTSSGIKLKALFL
jgi:hypothetical protein